MGLGVAKRHQQEMMERSDRVLGESQGILEARKVIQKISEVSWPVLILGETGTGKELVARSIHAEGPSNQKPFITVDCGLPLNLIEAELFGTEGQEVGNASTPKGRLWELADGGTLFLDEISELPRVVQSRIVRLLDTKIVDRANGEGPFRIGARIIAASSRDLIPLLHGQKFRKDLFFRLNAVSIRMPPLRERKSDIPLLVQDMLRRISASFDGMSETRPNWVLSAKALDTLLLYDWPGNVRELEDCIKRAVIMGSGRVLDSSDLFPPSQVLSLIPRDDTHGTTFPLRERERKAIMESIFAAGGKKDAAAKMLGIGKSTLYRKLHGYQERATPKTLRRRSVGNRQGIKRRS